ncbi:hypothetical protein O7606_14300 [Micromonospora sp. WMMD882]|uniref:hypothetical protein n=1 Tax=Micromonospora sp. WMMD882 TaxID=3015151 RepID=UPI00248B426A|nr:hypothetical protein [Micromonospora sp. WMMD882]WBB77459.1 hypothetical protein O7606_14300 [Micromonospora sp. WMMD882]
MRIRRWSAGVLAASLLVPALTACGSADTAGGTPAAGPSAGGPPATPADGSPAAPAGDPEARAALLASTRELSKGDFSFTIAGGGLDGAGRVHLPTRSAEMSLTGGDASDDLSMELHLVFVDTDTWVKVQLGGAMATAAPADVTSGKYQHLDRSRIKGLDRLAFDFTDVDPAGSEALTRAVTDVRKTGAGMYAGTLDATRVGDSKVLDAATVRALAGKASALPFTAKLDAQGRLTEFGVEIPAAGDAKARNLLITYADYGATTPVQQPPAGQVVEASDDVYKLLG